MPNPFELIKRHKARFMALCLWLGIVILARTVMAVNDLTVTELADEVVRILRMSWYGPLIFVILFALRPLLLIPGTILNVVAGMVYGFPFGLIVTMTAGAVSATTTYTVSHKFIEHKPQFEGRTGRIVSFMQNHPFEAVLTLQLMYLSLDLISTLAGALHLSFRRFIVGVILGGIVGNGLSVLVGSSIEGSVAEGDLSIRPEMIVLSVIVLVISLSISTFLRRRNAAKLKE